MTGEFKNFSFNYPVLLISGSYNVFNDGWDGIGVYMASGLYKSETFRLPIYIGSSINLQNRIEYGHIYNLDRNKHPDNPIFQISWNKHGKESFVWWLLETSKEEETTIIEQKYLDLYRPFKDEFGGFNIAHDASCSAIGRKHSEETKEKISKSNMDKKVSDETRRKISETRKRNFQSGKLIHPQLGKKMSQERRDKISKSNTGKPNYNSRKKVLCIESGIIYDSIREAAKSLDLNTGGISNACRGVYKTCGRLHWRYLESEGKVNG